MSGRRNIRITKKTTEENHMTLINDGTLTIEKGYTEQFLELLIDQNI